MRKALALAALTALGACAAPVVIALPDLSRARSADVHNAGPGDMRLVTPAGAPVLGAATVKPGETVRVRDAGAHYVSILLKGTP